MTLTEEGRILILSSVDVHRSSPSPMNPMGAEERMVISLDLKTETPSILSCFPARDLMSVPRALTLLPVFWATQTLKKPSLFLARGDTRKYRPSLGWLLTAIQRGSATVHLPST